MRLALYARSQKLDAPRLVMPKATDNFCVLVAGRSTRGRGVAATWRRPARPR